ncbi:MAG: insulinase family protein [Hamadaea sp.]|nr:insulinase family protein [Hamadaea sp.]NUR47205.1 insulinase family protein [Hamadaea sp.]
MTIEFTEVDGVPTLVAPTAGPWHAGLVFRVGRADETLARSGLTHVLEHLVLFPLGLTDYHYNGSTGSTVTSFHTTGSEEDVAAFLHQVCSGLAAPPMNRLDTEKQIVRTEWASRTSAVNDGLPIWRYGARGHGLLSFREPGTWALTAEDLLQWRDAYFTRENAVLWIAGKGVPAGLRLDLPSGRRMPLPPVTSALPTTPAYFAEGGQAVVVESIVTAGPAAPVYADVLERTLFRDLRQEAGVSYSVSALYQPRGDGFGEVTAAVDALPDKQGAAVGGFVDALAKLQAGRIEAADINAYVAKVKDAAQHADAEAAGLGAAAFATLTGRPVIDVEQRIARLESVTTEDVHAVAREAGASALMRVPHNQRADWAGFTAAPTLSTSTVDGVRLKARGGDGDLVLGPQGISVIDGECAVTVRFDEVAAMWSWPDGGRRLVGHDGLTLTVEPTLNNVGAAHLARIDAAVPRALVIPMPARQADAIPQPSAVTPAVRPAKAARRPAGAGQRAPIRALDVIRLVLLVGITTVFLCLSGMFTIAGDEGPDAELGRQLTYIFWGITAIGVAGTAWVIVGMARRRR